jgi:hypothetical protein
MPAALGWLLTMLFVVLAFMIFRAPDMATVTHMTEGLLGQGGPGRAPGPGVLALIGVAMLLAVLPRPNPDLVDLWLRPQQVAAAATALVATYVMLEVGRGAPSSFIYFQF